MNKIHKILRGSVLGLAAVAMTACNTGSSDIVAEAWDATFNGKALIVGAIDSGYTTYNGTDLIQEGTNSELPDFTYNEVAKDDLTARMTNALGANNPGQLPDIVQIEDYTAPSYLSRYSDYFYPVQNVGAEASDFADVKAEPATYNNTLYGIPFDASPAIIAIEIKPLIEVGLVTDTTAELESSETAIVSLEQMRGNSDAWTWDKFVELGTKASELIDAHNEVFEKYGIENFIGMDKADIGHIRTMLQSAGTWYTTGNGEDTVVTFENNEAFRQALQVTHELYANTKVKDLASATDNYNNWDGNTICGITASWITSSITNTASNEGNWAFVQMPILTDDSGNPLPGATHYSALGGSGFYVINKGNETKAKQAAEYLYNAFGNIEDDTCKNIVNKLASTGPATDYNTGIGSVLGVKGTDDLSNYNAENTFFYHNQKTTADFAAWNQAPGVNYGDYTYDIESAIYESVYEYTQPVSRVSLDECIANVQQAAEARLSR